MTFPALPYLIDGETKLTDTYAIMKYIASKHGPFLLGSDPAQTAQIEMLASVVQDLKQSVTLPCYTTGDRAGITTNLLQKVKPIVAYLGQKNFLVDNDDPCYVDFAFFELCDFMNWISEGKLF